MNGKSERGKHKLQQQHPVCIFCGRTPLTKEHVWPNWLKNVLEEDDSNTRGNYLINTDFLDNNVIEITPNYIKRNGKTLNHTLKIVCEDCNNNWMSQIESKAKPILESLILNKPIVLNRSQQKFIIQWAILRTIISEYTDQPTKAITAKERKTFYQTNEGPANWYVWIAKKKSNSETWPVYHHIAIKGAYQQRGGFLLNKSPYAYNTQSSYFGLGECIIYTFSWPIETLRYRVTNDWAKKMISLHPNENYQINWPDVPCMNDIEVDDLRRNIVSLASQIKFLTGP